MSRLERLRDCLLCFDEFNPDKILPEATQKVIARKLKFEGENAIEFYFFLHCRICGGRLIGVKVDNRLSMYCQICINIDRWKNPKDAEKWMITDEKLLMKLKRAKDPEERSYLIDQWLESEIKAEREKLRKRELEKQRAER